LYFLAFAFAVCRGFALTFCFRNGIFTDANMQTMAPFTSISAITKEFKELHRSLAGAGSEVMGEQKHPDDSVKPSDVAPAVPPPKKNANPLPPPKKKPKVSTTPKATPEAAPEIFPEHH
jgi:hypothetical protein